MTVLGKILVFFNMVFSVLTAALIVMVFVTRTNWKTEYDRVRNLATVADTAYKVEKTTREDDAKKFRESIDELKREVDSQKANVIAKDKELVTVRDELLKVQLAAKSSDSNSVDARDELERVRKERKLLEDEKKLREVEIAKLRKDLDAQTQLAVGNDIARQSLQGKLDKLLNSYEQIVRQNKELQFKANSGAVVSNTGEGRTLTSPGPSAPANARGTVISFTGGLVTISIGSDSGIEPGTQLEVYRLNPTNPAASKYLGKVLIRQSKPKESVGQFYAASKELPEPGDEVGTLTR